MALHIKNNLLIITTRFQVPPLIEIIDVFPNVDTVILEVYPKEKRVITPVFVRQQVHQVKVLLDYLLKLIIKTAPN